jgi:hypothetical protein
VDSVLAVRCSSFARARGDGHFDPLRLALDDQFDGLADLQRVDRRRIPRRLTTGDQRHPPHNLGCAVIFG